MIACNNSAIDTAIHAALGPNNSAINVPPTACPVVPPTSGTLNIIPKKEKAAPTPRSGILSFGSSSFTFFTACAQTGTIAAPITPQVAGDK